MATFKQTCDSDEEIFWGPITAREIELDWRRLTAEKEIMKEAVKEEVFVNEGLNSGINNHSEKNEVLEDTKKYLDEVESEEGILNGSTYAEANVSLEDPDQSVLNNSSDQVEVCLRESTSSVKSFISVKGENHYEVFIPFNPIQQEVTSGLEASTNACTASEMSIKAEFVDIDLNCNSLVENKDAHETTEQHTNSTFLNVESQRSENLAEDMNNAEAAKVALNFDLENIAYIDDSLNMDFQVVPTNSVSSEIIDDGLPGSNVDKSLKIDSYGEPSSFEIKNITIDTKETTAIIVEELKMKVESMDLNSSYTHDQEILNSEQCQLDLNSTVCESNKTLPDSATEVTSTSMEERNTERQTDSSDLSFASLSEEKENNGGIRSEEMETYSPPDKKLKFADRLKQEENEVSGSNRPQNSKIPVLRAGSSKLPILNPSKLNILSNGSEWASGFKIKKVPKPKKPEYIVSPAKLSSLLKVVNVNKLACSQSTGNLYQRPTSAPLQTNNCLYNIPPPKVKPATASTLETPVSQKTPTKLKAGSASLLKTPSRNLKYKDIVSPVAEYIKCPKSVINRNVTPSKSVFQVPKGVSVNENLPKAKASPVLPKLGEKQAAVLVTPKPQIFRHIGRVNSEGKNINKLVGSQSKRRTSLQETSHAHLPQPDNMDYGVSVLESQ